MFFGYLVLCGIVYCFSLYLYYRFMMLIDGENQVYMLDRDNTVFQVPNLQVYTYACYIKVSAIKTTLAISKMWS